MLLNLWTISETPERDLSDDLRKEWRRRVREARREALDGRFPQAREALESLRQKLEEQKADSAVLAIQLELARMPQSMEAPARLSSLLTVRNELRANPQPDPLHRLLLAVAQSELQLLQFQRRTSLDPDKTPARQFSEAQQELVFNRVEAVSALGRRHPAIALLNLHLGLVSQGLRDHDSAVEFLSEAFACYARFPAHRFVHERSDVLMHLGEVAIDLGFLDQAEGLLAQALFCKSRTGDGPCPAARPPWHGRPGVPVPGGPWMTDRPGLVRCLIVLARLYHQQGRLYDALDAYTTSRRVSGSPSDRGFYVNRVAQIFLEAGAHDLARDVYRHNCPKGNTAPAARLNGAIARLGLARAELVRHLPVAPGGSEEPHHVQRRREARSRVAELLHQAVEDLKALRRLFVGGDNPAAVSPLEDWFLWVEALQHLLRGHELLDEMPLLGPAFEDVRQEVTRLARHFETRQPTSAGDLLWDLARLELWAWRAHRFVPQAPPPGEPASTFDRLLDLWETRGARARLQRLQEWAESVNLGDVSRVMLERYLPGSARGEEAGSSRPMTILFADLRDSSGHGQEAGPPEEITRLEADLFRAVNPVVRRHGGSILRYQGDSILVVFGLHGEAEHATQAVACALELQRAVQRLNQFRAAQARGSRPLELPVGIHTGEASTAHLMIPGRREVTVFGNPVNLAKRIQETPRAHPHLFNGRSGAVIGPLHELILISEETRGEIRAGAFRAFPLGLLPFKGYENAPVFVYAVRPVLPLPCSFVGLGSYLQTQPGVLALDVGNQGKPGVIDHHHEGAAGCATSLALDNPSWVTGTILSSSGIAQPEDVELVVHANPDFDCCGAVFMALESLESRPGPERNARRQVLRALATYATRIDAGFSDIEADDPAASPAALISVCEMLPLGSRTTSWLQRQRQWLGRGIQVLHEGVEASLRQDGNGAGLPGIFHDQSLPVLGELTQAVRQDVAVYREQDRTRIVERRFAVPRRAPASGWIEQRCGVITAPHCQTFKVWARLEGFTMLIVEYPKGELSSPDGEHRVPLRRFINSVLPDSGLTLADLAALLDSLETKRRAELLDQAGLAELIRSGEPRPGFDNPDPWYDGRAALLANTIIDAPRQGSVLELGDILAATEELYGCGKATAVPTLTASNPVAQSGLR
jgi:class 3 adenylate cyclase/tetratricopeptide (TPR) repeat protein